VGTASVRLHVQSNRGSSISERVGDLQGVSNIEAPTEWRLYEFWVEHNLLPGRLSVLAGVYDVNAEFDVVPVAGDFLNSSFGFGPDVSLTGINGPSTFPLTTLGLRIKARPLPRVYAALAVLDGSPGDPTQPDRSRFDLGDGEGALIAVELGYTRAAPGVVAIFDEPPSRVQTGGRRIGRGRTVQRQRSKVAVGGWTYTRDFERWQPGELAKSWGVYALGERLVYRGSHGDNGLSLFARAGTASDEVNQLSFYLGGGAVYSGIIPSRPNDVVQLGVAHARNGSPFLRALEADGDQLERAETVVEFGYRAQLGAFFSLQPDVQYVINPGMDRQLDNALVLGIRGMATLELPF
jgi:porin